MPSLAVSVSRLTSHPFLIKSKKMQKDTLNNIHVSSEEVLVTPDELNLELPVM